MLVIPPARRRSTRPLCALSGLWLTGARLRQLEASGHADAVAEWVRRRDGINKGLWKDGTLREVQVVRLTQKEELLSKLVIPPARRRSTAATGVKPAGKRGAASSAAAVPKKLSQEALKAKQKEGMNEEGGGKGPAPESLRGEVHE